MDISRDRFLSFARRIALVTSTAAPATVAACGGSTSNTTPTAAPIATTSASPTTGATSESPPPGDITAGSGPCRCSWDTDQAAAPRVCKKGEVNYEGIACIPGGGTSDSEGGYYPKAVPGPLPPPDLPVS